MNTNTPQENAKDGTIKVLAIVGFISVIVLAVWLSVQIVRVIPSAFSSLASVADSVYNNQPADTLTVVSEKSIVNTGESFRISWTDLGRTGDYSFYYACTEGVSIDVRLGSDNTASVQCDNPLLLPAGNTSIDMIAASERRRFIDVPFTIAFTATDESEPLFERDNKITVVNATIPQSVDVTIENENAENTDTDETTTADSNTEDTTTDNTETTPTTPAETIETTISYFPESHENGFTDLKITYLGVGILDGNNFTPTGSIDNDERGAIRFEVKNIGTKTSEKWTFEATLPTGYVFESSDQIGLKPNEKAVYTLGFDLFGQETGSKTIDAEIDVDNDTNSSNDSFSWSVTVTD